MAATMETPMVAYATNAMWPAANTWTRRPGAQRAAVPFRASREETSRTLEAALRAEARRRIKERKQQLFAAIMQRDAATVQHLLRDGLLLERHTPAGASPLGLAAAVGDAHIVTFLLDMGADALAVDRVGATPLMMAAYTGHTGVCQLLLSSKQGGNHGREYLLRQVTQCGETAAMAAAKMGHLDTLQLMMSAGSDPLHEDNEGVDLLMMAARKDRVEVAAYLIQTCGLNPGRMDKLGRTCLMHAAGGGASQAVLLLLQDPRAMHSLSSVDHQKRGALHHACLGGNVQVIQAYCELQALVAAGLRLDAADPTSTTLFITSCGAGNVDTVRWMLEQGIGHTALTEDGSHGPMFAAIKGHHYGVVEALLAAGARIDVRDDSGRTPLGQSACRGEVDMVRFLTARGADLLLPDVHGHVPRQQAQLAHQMQAAWVLSDLAKTRLVVADAPYRRLDAWNWELKGRRQDLIAESGDTAAADQH